MCRLSWVSIRSRESPGFRVRVTSHSACCGRSDHLEAFDCQFINRADAMIDINEILVPTDMSECSAEAAVQARELAKTFGARVHVLHIMQIYTPMVPEPMAVGNLPDIKSIRRTLDTSLRTWTQKYFGDCDSTVTRIITGRDFAEIVRYARDESIDLIVIGSHGASGIEHLLLGSVAERVVSKAPCPVLTVRQNPAENV